MDQGVRDCVKLIKLLDRCGSISVNRWLEEEEKAAFKGWVRRHVMKSSVAISLTQKFDSSDCARLRPLRINFLHRLSI